MWLKGSEALHIENKSLKKKLEAAERENRELKQSLYELTTKHSAALLQRGRPEVAAVENEADAAESDAQTAKHEAEVAQLAHQQREVEVKHRIEPPSTTGGDAGDSATALQFYYKYDLRGHTGAVYTVRFSPNGRLLASGSFDQTVRCWDIEKPLQQEETLCLQEHSHNVTDLSWSADSSLLLSCSYDHTVRLCDLPRCNLRAARLQPRVIQVAAPRRQGCDHMCCQVRHSDGPRHRRLDGARRCLRAVGPASTVR